MPQYLSPIGNSQQTSANGAPLVGGKIFTYLVGSTTPTATFTDSTGVTQQANPIILNSLGLPASPIWLAGGIQYKFVIQNASNVTVQTVDGISGVNDITTSASEWNETSLVPTYISPTSFSVPGDQTSILQVNRRVRSKVTAGLVYGRISASVFASTITTVTLVNDSTPLDSGLSLVATGILSFSPSSVPFGLYAAAGANTDITSVLSTVINSKIQPITASVAASALTVTINPTTLDFRSSTLGSGTVNTRSVPAAISVVVPSAATLGTVSAVQSRIVILAIDNAGTIETAVVNIAGGNDLSETGLISTTAISGSSNSANVIYSTTARTNLAYRVIGYVESTQATAGTWATAPSTIQGAGGNAVTAMSSLGYGQTWQNVTGSRTVGTTYYNTTGRPIGVSVYGTSGGTFCSLTVNGVANVALSSVVGAASAQPSYFGLIPSGASYVYANNATSVFELR